MYAPAKKETARAAGRFLTASQPARPRRFDQLPPISRYAPVFAAARSGGNGLSELLPPAPEKKRRAPSMIQGSLVVPHRRQSHHHRRFCPPAPPPRAQVRTPERPPSSPRGDGVEMMEAVSLHIPWPQPLLTTGVPPSYHKSTSFDWPPPAVLGAAHQLSVANIEPRNHLVEPQREEKKGSEGGQSGRRGSSAGGGIQCQGG